MSQSCPSIGDIADLLLGIADELSEETVVGHLRECADCRKAACGLGGGSDTLLSMLQGHSDFDPYAHEPQLANVIQRLQRGGRKQSVINSPSQGTDGLDDDTSVVRQKTILTQQLGPYRLLSLLGEGGMGTVYKAQHVHLEMFVAVKIMAARLTGDSQSVARFEREMKAVGSINHPNIVRASDAGEQNGRHFLAMEFVDGINLDQAMKRLGPLRISDACEAIRQAAVGIHQAHLNDITHRDLKPSNLMVTRDGQIKILDLGLSRLHNAPEFSEITDNFQVIGTVDYMAPEQALKATDVDGRADIYSLGCSLYALLCGTPPFADAEHTGSLKKLFAHQHLKPTGPRLRRPEIPAELSALIERAIAKSPEKRFHTAEDFAQQLLPFTAGAQLELLVGKSEKGASVEKATTKPQLEPAMAGGKGNVRDRGKRGFRGQLLVILLALSGLLSVGALLRFTTAHGTIIVEIDSDLVGAAIDGEELIITDKNTDSEFRIKIKTSELGDATGNQRVAEQQLGPGKYMIQVANPASGMQLVTSEFLIRRREEIVIKAYVEQPQTTPDRNRDRLVAEWVLDNDGDLEIIHSGKNIIVNDAAELPESSFLIYRIHFYRNVEITNDDYDRLAELKSLADVNFWGVHLNDELVEQLATLYSLETIQLQCKRATSKRMSPLRKLTNLTNLSLEGAVVTDSIVGQVAELGTLEQVTVVGGKLTEKCLPSLEKLRGLRLLQLNGCDLTTMRLEELRSLTHLSTLQLPYSNVTDSFFPNIGQLTGLRQIDLERTSISDDALQHIAEIPLLDHLGLAGNRITNQGVANLKPLQSLATLDLRATRVNDKAVEHLAQLKNLSLLKVGDRLSVSAVAELQLKLPNCNIEWTTPPSVPPSQRAVNEWAIQQGATVRLESEDRTIFASNIADLPDDTYQTIALNFVRPIQPTDAEFAMLRSLIFMNELSFLDLEVDDRVVEHLHRFSRLLNLKLHYDSSYPNGLERLATLPGPKHFTLGGAIVGDREIESIMEFNRIHGLTISGMQVTDASFAVFAEMKSVDFLSLIFTRVTGRGLAKLEALPSLVSLHFPYTQVTDEGLKEIGVLKNLVWLNLGFTAITDACLEEVAKLPSLETLELSHTAVGDKGIAVISKMKSLKTLRIEGTSITDAALEDLASMTQLTRLRVGSRLSETVVSELRQRLPNCQIDLED